MAGAASALAFAIIHDIFISDIWFSLPLLVVAGGLCGLCVGWTYGLLAGRPSIRSWLRYNALFVGMFVFLGVVSVLLFEPVSTIPELMASNGLPDHLFSQAMPMTTVSTLAMAAIIGRLYGRTWAHYAAILLTCTVLVLLLGLNVSVIGLVFIPGSSIYLIAELFGLILALNLVYAVMFIALEWKNFVSSD
ncbi:MAG: hypothetical protein P8Y14_29410 [Anaerolineales bacterium]